MIDSDQAFRIFMDAEMRDLKRLEKKVSKYILKASEGGSSCVTFTVETKLNTGDMRKLLFGYLESQGFGVLDQEADKIFIRWNK